MDETLFYILIGATICSSFLSIFLIQLVRAQKRSIKRLVERSYITETILDIIFNTCQFDDECLEEINKKIKSKNIQVYLSNKNQGELNNENKKI